MKTANTFFLLIIATFCWAHNHGISSDLVSPKLDCAAFDAEQAKIVADKKETAAKLAKLPLPDQQLLKELLGPDLDIRRLARFPRSVTEDIQAKFAFRPDDVRGNIAQVTKNPDIMLKLTDCQLNYVLRWKEVIDGLDHDTLRKIMMSEEITERIQKKIPHSTFASLIQIRPDFIETINSTFPGLPYVSTLLREESFISKLNVSYIARVIENDFIQDILTIQGVIIAFNVHQDLIPKLGLNGQAFVHSFTTQTAFYELLHPYDLVKHLEDPHIGELLTEESFLTALSVYPDLPRSLGPIGLSHVQELMHSETFIQALRVEDVARIIQYPNIQAMLTKESVFLALNYHPNLPGKLGHQAMDFGSRFLTDQDFLSALPCEVYMNAAQNSTMVNDMDPKVLQAFSSNEHFWACLPIEFVKHMMATTQIGTKLDITDLIRAALTMSKAQRKSPALILPIFQIQLPQVTSRMESDFYDWWNAKMWEKDEWLDKYLDL